MKHTILFLLVFALFACAVSAEPMAGIPNPVQEKQSLAEINEPVGSFLCHPPVMGVTDEAFGIIDCTSYLIAQYLFQVNGYRYCFRAAKTEEDISGIWTDGQTAFPAGRTETISFAEGEGIKAARWFNAQIQYTLSLEDPDSVIDSETFRLIAEEMMEVSRMDDDVPADADLSALAGEYMDAWSGRARLTAEVNDDGVLVIEVDWADSAFELVRWTMSASLLEDGRFSYEDCAERVISYDDNGNESAATVYDKGQGYFTVSGNTLLWDGASDEHCRQCIFEKTEY